MIFEVKGIGIPNKGAELMLAAIQQEVLSRIPNAKFACEPHRPYMDRCRYGLLQKIPLRSKSKDGSFLLNLLPKKYIRRYGIVKDKDIRVIFDASGFAYGDQWGVEKLRERLGCQTKSWENRDKKVILLPQAFGPFSSNEFKDELKKVVSSVDLIFARDRISYEYLTGEVGENNKIALSGDFTNLVKGSVPSEFPLDVYDICVIPNNKMIEMNAVKDRESYIDLLSSLIQLAKNHGKKVFILVHEGKKDWDLAVKTAEKVGSEIDIYTFENPVHIKGVIGKAKIVISSRFHGLVSALSQGVPSIATGWSHKYAELMQDYGCEEFLVDSPDAAIASLEKLLDDDVYAQVKEAIDGNSDRLKQETRAMWDRVFDSINAG